MIELLDSMPPLAKLLLGIVAVVTVAAVAYEIGLVGLVCGAAALAWTTAQNWDGLLVALAVILATVLGGVGHALVRPQLPCLLCKGEPRNYGIGGAWSDCWLCGGSGKRRRLGSKVLSRHRKH